MNSNMKAITGKEKPEDISSPYHALVNFYSAFNNQQLELMESNWKQTDEASMSNPLGGVKRGWPAIKEVYKNIFFGKASVYVEFFDYSLHPGNDMFIAVGKERGRLIIENTVIDLSIRTSRLYQREQGHWKQLHHHGSMDDPSLLETYQKTIFKHL